MKITSSAMGFLALLPNALASHEVIQGFLVPEKEQKHTQEQVQKNVIGDAYETAEVACMWDAQTVCAPGSTLPNSHPDFTFSLFDPNVLSFDSIFHSMLSDLVVIDLSDNQELNGFSSHRRLAEVEVHEEPKYLFNCPRVHTCLLQANKQQDQVVTQAKEFSDGFFFTSSSMRLLSHKCSHALSELKPKKETTNNDIERSLYHHESHQVLHPVLHKVEQKNLASTNKPAMTEVMALMTIDFLWLISSALLFCTCVGVLVRNCRRYSSSRRGQNRTQRRNLKRSILQQIYSNPNLKSQVEAAMGESIGDVPPFPVSSQHAQAKRQLKKKIIRLLTMLMIFTIPFILLDSSSIMEDDSCCYAALYFLSSVMIFVLVRAHYRTQKIMSVIEDDDCTCCCCGGSASNVISGNISKEQACCGCCQGTGVCPPACQLCCTDENGNCDDCCGCCGKDKVECGCIETSKTGTYRAPRVDTLTVEDGAEKIAEGDCCCCSASIDANPELLTVEQIGCLCCGGTGECSKECSACCGMDCDKECCKDNDCCDNTGSCCEPKSDEKVSIKSSTMMIIDGEPMIVV